MYSSLGMNKLVCCHLCCLSVCRLTSSYRMNVLVHYPIHRFVHGPKPVCYQDGSFQKRSILIPPLLLPHRENLCRPKGKKIFRFTSVISSVGEHGYFLQWPNVFNTNSKTMHYLFQENIASLPHIQLIPKSTSEASQLSFQI